MTKALSGHPARSGPGAGRYVTSGSLAVLALAIAGFSLLPLGFVAVMTVGTGWHTAAALIFRPRVGELLGNTVVLIALTVPLCLIVGTGAAFLVERTRLRGHRGWALVLAVPLAIPAFVSSYGWVSAVPSLAGVFSGVLIATLAYYPLVYIPAAAALSRLDPALEESAAALGRAPWSVFFRVVLPQLRLPLTGGALLVGLHLLSEYGAFAMIRFDTFTTAIMVQFQSTYNGSAGNMLAGVLVLLCLFLLVVEVRSRGRARYARIGPGSPAGPTRASLGAYQLPGQLALILLTGLAIGVPMASVLRWTVQGGAAVWAVGDVGAILGQTIGYAGAGAGAAVLVALPLAYLAVRRPSWFSRSLELANYVTSSMPGIVVGLAFVTISIRLVPGLYQTPVVLIAAYVLLFLPRALVSIRSGLAQAPEALEEAARALGVRPTAAFVRVTLRLAAPGAAAGAALVFLAVVTELTATLLLAPNGTRTLATQFWARTSEIDYTGAAPYAVLMVALSLPITFVLFRASRRSAGQLGSAAGPVAP